MSRIWPRAESKLYEEPKKLVAHGLARATSDSVGERPRTVYTITAEGRRALRAWLGETADGPVLEWEQLVKVSFAEHGTREDLLDRLAEARAWAIERNEENLATGRAYAAGESEFQHRMAINALGGAFLTDYYRLVADWSAWATTVVEEWPDDLTQASVDPAAYDVIVQRAAWSEDPVRRA